VAEPGAERLLDLMAEDLRRAIAAGIADHPHVACLDGMLLEEQGAIYLEGVRRVIDYVLAGDVFQVNLSRLWTGKLKPGLSHAAIYDRLRKRNPSPFAGLATLGERAIICSSPERLVEVEGRVVQTRPIAGTRPRGTSGLTDVALSEELIAHPKERAEHIMLVDLERNDLSRVCVPGSVKVNESMVIESYAQVHHIVSNIRGQLYDDVPPGDVIRAVFPGGTITGCPKVRCMEIIAELERVGRGPYTGSMGYVNRDGGMDLNILIRTLVREGDSISLRAGAGIVADSIPERELEETRAKAGAIVLALVTED
ncbi:MAG TPA: chorismate-binding protein, partial [Alphaproteobacteria bacterium]|nr:chorismate-binding protein [Alphaproteobacteria bacterium]